MNTDESQFNPNLSENRPIIPTTDKDTQPETPFTTPIQPSQEKEEPEISKEAIDRIFAEQEQKTPLQELQQQMAELNKRLESQEEELAALRGLVGNGLIYLGSVFRSNPDNKKLERSFGELGSTIRDKTTK